MRTGDKKRKTGIIERLVDAVSPRTASRRAFYRAKTEHFRLMETSPDYRNTFLALLNARGYRAAKQSKNQTPWLGLDGTADSQVVNDLPALMNRSRELNRDDPIGSGITGTFARNIVGTGIRPQARTDFPKKNRLIEKVFDERKNSLAQADDLTYAKHQEVVLRKVLEDGGVFVKEARSKPGEPVWFETVEKDRVKTPAGTLPQDAEGAIIDGVEKDRYGRPVAYWVAKATPGKNALSMTKDDFVRVEKENMVHLRIVERPGQTHGVPVFHAILQDIRDLDLLMLAALKRVQIAACLAVFLKSSEAIESMVDVTAQKYGYRLDQDIEPGMIFKLMPNEEVQTLTPNFPIPELEPFVIMLARRIGAALGITWQMVLKDFSQANYSSARTDLLESRQVFVVFQNWLIEKVLGWEWRTVLEDAKLRGDKRLAGVKREELALVHWIPNGWRWVDPVKEVQATQLELQMGITCLRDVCASQGKDWEEVQDQRLAEEMRERNRREELGLPPPARIVVRPPEKKGTLKTDVEADDRGVHVLDQDWDESEVAATGGNGRH